MSSDASSKILVQRLRRLYLACLLPPPDLATQLSQRLSAVPGLTSQLLSATLASEESRRWPPPRDFAQRFLSRLLRLLEGQGLGLDEAAYEALGRCAPDGHQVFLLPSAAPLVLPASSQDATAALRDGTTGFAVWEGSSRLVRWALADGAERLRGKRVLELGAGTGLSGLALVRLAAPTAYRWTDGHSGVVERLRKTLRLNFPQEEGCGTEVSVGELDWAGERSEALSFAADVVVGSDVSFDPASFPALLGCVEALLGGGAKAAHLLHTVRDQATLDALREDVGKRAGLKASEEWLGVPGEGSEENSDEDLLFPSATGLLCPALVINLTRAPTAL